MKRTNTLPPCETFIIAAIHRLRAKESTRAFRGVPLYFIVRRAVEVYTERDIRRALNKLLARETIVLYTEHRLPNPKKRGSNRELLSEVPAKMAIRERPLYVGEDWETVYRAADAARVVESFKVYLRADDLPRAIQRLMREGLSQVSKEILDSLK